jgi:thiol:disulfide interchange protein
MNNYKSGSDRAKHTSGRRKLFKWSVIVVLLYCVYLGNTFVQSYLGTQVLQSTGLALNTLDEALLEAQRSNKLVLADMSAIWCPTCRKLDKLVFSDKEVQAIIEQGFVFARIEYDSKQGEDFMQKYQVRGFPTLLILGGDGEKLVKLPLTFEPQTFINMLTQIIAKKT